MSIGVIVTSLIIIGIVSIPFLLSLGIEEE